MMLMNKYKRHKRSEETSGYADQLPTAFFNEHADDENGSVSENEELVLSVPVKIGVGKSNRNDADLEANKSTKRFTKPELRNHTKRRKTGLVSFGPGKRKRFIWSEELHKDFLMCIFDIGLKVAKPRVLMEKINSESLSTLDTLSASQLKRNLSKYRKNISKARKMFRENIEASMEQIRLECVKSEMLNNNNSNGDKRMRNASTSGKAQNAPFHVYPMPRGEQWEVPIFHENSPEPMPKTQKYAGRRTKSYQSIDAADEDDTSQCNMSH